MWRRWRPLGRPRRAGVGGGAHPRAKPVPNVCDMPRGTRRGRLRRSMMLIWPRVLGVRVAECGVGRGGVREISLWDGVDSPGG